MDLSQADPILGRTVGHFLLQSKLGEGGMGLVYKARNEQTHQETAVKVLRTHLTTNERVVKRFHREAQAQNHLRHDNIVYVHDFGFEEGVGFYIAMEFLRGKSMEEILVENPEMLTVVFVQSIVRQVCDAMGFAHSRGIYHRDLKPDNIFLVDQGIWDPSIEQRVKVLDFGVAKMVASEEDERLTRTGMTIGTPRYMAPEQAGDGKADHRSDIYSLGVILFEMLTGQSPFEGSSAYQIMLRHVYADPPSLLETRPDIPYPKSLEAFLQRTMAKEPQKRPASMDMFWQELAPCLQQLEAMLGPSISMHAQANGSFRRAQGIDNYTPETAEPPVIVGRMVQSQGSLDRVSTTPPPTAVRPIISPQAENSSWLQMEDLEFWEESVDQETQMGESAPSGPVGQAYPPPSRGVLSPIPPSRSSDLSPTVRTSTLSSGENAVPAAYRTRNPGISASQTPAPKTSLGSNLNIRASKDSKRTKSRQRGAVKARALKQKPSSSAKSKALLFSFVVLLLSTIAACAWYYTTQIQ